MSDWDAPYEERRFTRRWLAEVLGISPEQAERGMRILTEGLTSASPPGSVSPVGSTNPHGKETSMAVVDDVAAALLDVLIDQHGGDYGEPDTGRLIHTLAEEAGVTYGQCSVALRYLERLDLIEIERQTHPDPGHHNLLIRVWIR